MKKNLVIGCDYDGTLTDLYGFYKTYGEKLYKKNVVDNSKYGLMGMFGISKKNEILFGLKYFLKYCKNEDIKKGARELFKSEKLSGTKVHAITARKYATNYGFFGKYMRKFATNYAVKNDIDFDSFEFCSEKYALRDKYIACQKLGVDIMIDDLPEVALYLAKKNILVALMDAPYNKKIKHKNIFRCYTFEDVKKLINDHKKDLKNVNDDFEILNNENLNSFKKQELKDYYEDYKGYLKKLNFDKKNIEIGKKRYKFLYYIISFFTLRFLLVKVKNKHNIPYQDGLIIVSNHLDSMDQFSIAYALKKKYITGYAASSIKSTFRGKLANYTKSAIFVDRNDSKSKKKAKREFDLRLVNGYNALVFPEGTRKNKYKKYDNKDLLEFKLGAFSSSKITGASILPVAIYKKKKTSLKSTVIIGEAFNVQNDTDLKTSAKSCEKVIKKLLSEERDKNETINKKKIRVKNKL